MSFSMIMMIVRIVFLVIALLAVVVIINIAMNMNLESKQTEAALLIGRIFHSPEGISYVDQITGRVSTGVIDLDNVNDTRLDNGMYIRANNRISAKIEIYKKKEPWGYDFVKDAKFNRDIYDVHSPMAQAWSNAGGIGGIAVYKKKYPVVILMPDGSYEFGKVQFTVLIPKSAK
ncbi:MAG: hypothetical protein KJ574_04710 [Nanoarchaeota archaeon]|nr:hypothetical protein [Nanoarchaeota archaeon]